MGTDRRAHHPDCVRTVCTTKLTGHDADVARARGWTVGTVIEGREDSHLATLVITAIGERMLLARPVNEGASAEDNWMLWCRCWREVAR